MLSRLVVIGNGFDLAHGLHTKYSDFMKYLCSYEKPPQIIYDRFVLLDSVSAQDQERHRFYEAIGKYIPEEDLWSSFEEALGFLDYEQIILVTFLIMEMITGAIVPIMTFNT